MDEQKAAEQATPGRSGFIRVSSGCDCDPLVYSREQLEWLLAVEAYQAKNRRRFPSWTEVLGIALALGYRKVADPQPTPKAVWRRVSKTAGLFPDNGGRAL